MIEIFYVALSGFFFAFLQFAFFFTLESNISSAGLTYLVISIAWFCGAIIGLSLPRRQPLWMENSMVAVGVAGCYFLTLWTRRHPFDNSYLWLYFCLIVTSSIYSGYFYVALQHRFENVKHLFFWENNGFILGIIASFIQVCLIGQNWMPLVLCSCGAVMVGIQTLLVRDDISMLNFESTYRRFTEKT